MPWNNEPEIRDINAMTEETRTRLRELLAAYDDGVYTLKEVFTRIVMAFDPKDFADLIEMLPEDLKPAFEDWAEGLFGGDASGEPIFLLTQEGTVPKAATGEIRRWLAARGKG